MTYVIEASNTLCPEGPIAIEECRDAIGILNSLGHGLNWVGEHTNAGYPKGCYSWSNDVYYNTIDSGNAISGARPICAYVGK